MISSSDHVNIGQLQRSLNGRGHAARAGGGRELAVAHPHRRGPVDLLQRLRQDEVTVRLQLVVVGEHLVDDCVDLALRHDGKPGLIGVDEAEVPHGGACGSALPP